MGTIVLKTLKVPYNVFLIFHNIPLRKDIYYTSCDSLFMKDIIFQQKTLFRLKSFPLLIWDILLCYKVNKML